MKKKSYKIEENETLIDYQHIKEPFIEIIEEIISKPTILPPFDGHSFSSEILNQITLEIQSSNFSNIIESEILIKFGNYLKNEFSPFISGIINFWPPLISNPTLNIKYITALLIHLSFIIGKEKSLSFIHWVSNEITPSIYKHKSHYKSEFLKACCLCKRKRKIFTETRFFWANIDQNNELTLYRIENGELKLHKTYQVSSIQLSRSGNTIKLFDLEGNLLKRFNPIDSFQLNLWKELFNSNIPLPRFFGTSESPIPFTNLLALYHALISEDMLTVQSLAHYSVSKVAESLPIAEALFDVFSYAGKVNQLLIQLSYSDFSVPELSHTTVLRGNSHLTTMFKVFFNKFGIEYYNKFLKKIIEYVDKNGDIGLKDPNTCNKERAEIVVFTLLNSIVNSIKYVPLEMRHFASILKSMATTRFNSKQATYNTLSGFFCLRFLSAILSNPQSYDSNIKINSDFLRVMVPISQLLMNPFNLIEFRAKYDVFSNWNKRVLHHIYPKLFKFVFDIGTISEIPFYNPPNQEKLIHSLNILWNEISKSKDAFTKKYNELSNQNLNHSAFSWSFSTFLNEFFKNK